MPLVERFEDLECWQATRELVTVVNLVCRSAEPSLDRATSDQLRRAALSGMNNVAEGFGRRFHRKEFIRFLGISAASVIEVQSITYALEDLTLINLENITSIRETANYALRKILSLIRYLSSRGGGST